MSTQPNSRNINACGSPVMGDRIGRRMQYVLFVLLSLALSPLAYGAKTYITLDTVEVHAAVNGERVETWPSRTLFTSSSQDSEWVRVSGHFPEGVWQPLRPHLFIANSQAIKERATITAKAPKAVIYQTLKGRASKARAYRLLESTPVFNTRDEAEAYWTKTQIGSQALEPAPEGEAELSEFKDEVASQLEPELAEGLLVVQTSDNRARWPKGFNFTSNLATTKVVKATGYFPEGKWQRLPVPKWLVKPLKLQDRTTPSQFIRPEGAKRFAVIDKTQFEVTIYEVLEGEEIKLMKAPVALGYDRCLSQAKGGKCYYTPEGQYEIEFKLFDADGIEWCVSKKMEAEFKAKIARGERCWRGVMGRHAMHFGNSLFLHGTSNPRSIGSRSTHGCVRLRNSDIDLVFRLLQKGDKVLISEQPEEFDLVALASDEEVEIVEEQELEVEPTPKKTTKITLIEQR